MIREGEAGDRFYVVADGHVTVTASGRQVFEGGPGYYFGEIACCATSRAWRRSPRPSTPRCSRSSATSSSVPVTGHSDSSAAADAVVASRLWASRPALLEL